VRILQHILDIEGNKNEHIVTLSCGISYIFVICFSKYFESRHSNEGLYLHIFVYLFLLACISVTVIC